LIKEYVLQIKSRNIPYLVVFIVPALLLAPIMIENESLYWGTPGLQFIPWRILTLEMLKIGELPLWNPLNGMGAPLLANYQLAFFYLPSWIIYIFGLIGGPEFIAWSHTLVLYLHLVWAGLGMIGLLKFMKIQPLGQIIGALGFIMSGCLVSRSGFFSMVWTAAWFPWVIYYASGIAAPIKGFTSHIKNGHVKLTVAVAMMLLAGHAQYSWYILIFAAFWLICGLAVNRHLTHTGKKFAEFIGCLFVSVCLAAIQLVPTAEYLLQSQRSSAVDYQTALSYSFWPWRFFTLFAPNFFGNPGFGNYWGYGNYWEDAVYIGIIPLILALFSFSFIFSKRLRKNFSHYSLIVFLWAIVITTIILALGWNTPVFPFLYKNIPTFDMFNAPTRFMLWMVFSFSILAGVASELWERPVGRGLYWLRLATMGGFAITFGAILTSIYLPGINRTFINALTSSGLLLLCFGFLTLRHQNPLAKHRKVWEGIVVIILSCDLIFASQGLIPTTHVGFYDNKNEITVSVDKKRTYIPSQDEYFLKFNRFLRFDDYKLLEPINNFYEVGIPNANIIQSDAMVTNFDPFVPGKFQEFLIFVESLTDNDNADLYALMNISEIKKVNPDNTLGIETLPVKSGHILRFVENAIFVDNKEDALSEMHKIAIDENASFDNFVVIEGAVKTIGLNQAETGTALVRFTNISPTAYEIEAVSNKPGWVVLSQTWYPGWQAEVNGHQTELLNVNYVFSGLPVESGKSNITLKYRPMSLRFGSILSGVSLILMLIFSMYKYKTE
jgi:uncharacterized membrane protein YfhO